MKKVLAATGVACLVAMNLALAATVTCVSFVGGTLKFPCNMSLMKQNVMMGRDDVWPGAPDFLMNIDDRSTDNPGNMIEYGTPKLGVRSLVVADNGDAPDLMLRRAGNGNKYNEQPGAITGGTNIANIYWQTWGGSAVNGGKSWAPGNGNSGRNAAIFSRACGDQTASSRAGQLTFATTPVGNPGNPVERMRIGCDGTVEVYIGGKMRKVVRDSNGFLKAN